MHECKQWTISNIKNCQCHIHAQSKLIQFSLFWFCLHHRIYAMKSLSLPFSFLYLFEVLMNGNRERDRCREMVLQQAMPKLCIFFFLGNFVNTQLVELIQWLEFVLMKYFSKWKYRDSYQNSCCFHAYIHHILIFTAILTRIGTHRICSFSLSLSLSPNPENFSKLKQS